MARCCFMRGVLRARRAKPGGNLAQADLWVAERGVWLVRMIHPRRVSIAFRKLFLTEIVALVRKAGLHGIGGRERGGGRGDRRGSGVHRGAVAVLPKVSNIHVLHWWPTAADRRRLAEGEGRWAEFLRELKALPGERYAMLEFVPGDMPEAFLRDAGMLERWLGGAQAEARLGGNYAEMGVNPDSLLDRSGGRLVCYLHRRPNEPL